MVDRNALRHTIRAACQIVEQPGILIVGSQSVLATWSEMELPDEAMQSQELDACPLDDDDAESLANRLDGAAGEFSHFHEMYGFYIDGVGKRTATLPDGFEERLVAVSDEGTAGYVGYCLDPHDLCVAKLVANRDKDREFVHALIQNRLVSPVTIEELSWQTNAPDDQLARLRDFIADDVQKWTMLDIEPLVPTASLMNPDVPLPSDLMHPGETAAEPSELLDYPPAPSPADAALKLLKGHTDPYQRRDGTWVSGYPHSR